jgi:ATP-dependent Clp protease ATP-binding subunit ClpC
MLHKFLVFIQQHPDGLLVFWPPNPGIQAYDADETQAVVAVARQIAEHMRARDRRGWAPLFANEHEQPRLHPLSLELQPKGKPVQPPIAVTINLLLRTQTPGEGQRFVLTVPVLPGLHLVVDSADKIEPAAREAIQHLTRKWDSEEILALDKRGEERLAVIDVELAESASEAEGEALSNTHSQENVLGLCGLNLTDQARRSKLGHADRRDALVEMLITSLGSERAGSVMLVGKADVGKTALLHELVDRINHGRVPDQLRGREVWFVTANNLIAGMKYTGEWQGRTQKLIDQVRRGRQILYMADPNEILDAGRWSGSDNNMGRFLRPYIESGEMTVICECAPEGFAAGMRVEPSFMNAFRRIDIDETDEADTQAILSATARRLESSYGITIDPAAAAGILELTRRFMPYRAFPGKAVRFLEEMIHDAQVIHAEKGIAGRAFGRPEVIASFTQKTGLPAFMLSDEAAFDVEAVRAYFEERLLGQPEAVAAMVDLITVIKAGLNDPNKPLGSFFFVGPTGVGKTELAKVLAEFLFGSRDRTIRFDMSEYAAADALPRLIGTAWKSDSEGELTRRVREQPFCVVLFDELEKAHNEVYDALLGVLGEARLSDASGRTADFRNAIIIMTSNLGASRREMQSIGFRDAAPADHDADAARLYEHFVKEAERFFRPEFFNRIDRIVAFRPLTLDAVRLITRRELGKLLMREGVVRRNLLVEIDDAVIEKLLQRGFHPLYGARPLQREIERAVILPLARLVLRPHADLGSLLRFSVRGMPDGDDRIDLSLVPLDSPEDVADVAPAVPPPDRRLEHDLASVLRAAADLRDALASEEATPVVQQLRREVSRLLLRTREPSFWDQAAQAREVLGRVYHLERVLKRLDGLVERAEFLEEKGRQIRAHRDRRGVPALAREVESLVGEFAYLQLELAGAGVGRGLDAALLRITPLSREAEDWAAELVAMYTAWAARKGYEHTLLDLGPSGDGVERRYHGPALPPAIYLRGSYVYEFLAGESGLHKLNAPADDARRRILARVMVLPVNAPPDDDPARMRAALSALVVRASDGAANRVESVARVYNQGRHRFVRDPQTGVRVTDIGAVLGEGQIDPFLLASLRQRATAADD